MIRNKLKHQWSEGRAAINGWLSIANSFSAEVMAAQGYDSLTIDLQHGVVDYADAVTMFQAMGASGIVPMARVPWLDPAQIMKALDAGALGIICPMVNTAQEAALFASYCRYPPRGQRSFGPTRAIFGLGADYFSHANDEVLVIAMIETDEAVKNARAICQTPGIDGIYIGPSDLTLGVTNGRLAPRMDRDDEEIVSVIKSVLAEAKAAGLRACLHCGSSEYGAKAVGWGFDLVTVGSDAKNLAAASAADVKSFRVLTGQDETPGNLPGY